MHSFGFKQALTEVAQLPRKFRAHGTRQCCRRSTTLAIELQRIQKMAQNGHYLSVDCKPGRGGCAMDESQACIAVAAMPTACQTLIDSPPFLTK